MNCGTGCMERRTESRYDRIVIHIINESIRTNKFSEGKSIKEKKGGKQGPNHVECHTDSLKGSKGASELSRTNMKVRGQSALGQRSQERRVNQE